jgi:membrane protein DedA with SNARE-associated domain
MPTRTLDLLIFTIINAVCCLFWTMLLLLAGYDGFLVSMTAFFSVTSLLCGVSLLKCE